MLKKKSIVLSDTLENSNKKAVLSLEENGVDVKGTLRLYNFPRELDGVSSLGFYVQQKVYKAGLTWKANMLYEFFIDLKEIPSKFSCAVVNFQNAIPKPILFGSSEGSEDNVYASIISEIAGNNTLKNTNSVLDKYGVDFEAKEKSQIEKDIDNTLCEKDCANCVYKKFFFENAERKETEEQTQKTEKEEVFANAVQGQYSSSSHNLKTFEQTDEKKAEMDEQEELFFDKLKPQIDKLFAENPSEDNLESLIPSSKWAKVEYEDEGDFYVFGLLYDEEENVRYVCYGVPAVFEEQPPKELSGYPIWLPLNKNNSQGFGYWLTYQDASTGQPVKAIIE